MNWMRNLAIAGAVVLCALPVAVVAQVTAYAPTMNEPPPGVDSNAGFELPYEYKRQAVFYRTNEEPGTIIVNTHDRFLYLVQGNNRAIRYGVGVGRDGFQWGGIHRITRKSEWPDWTPPTEMIARQPYLPRFMAGGPGNPMGARAMYIGTTRLSRARHQCAGNDRAFGVIRLLPAGEFRDRGPVFAGPGRHQDRRSASLSQEVVSRTRGISMPDLQKGCGHPQPFLFRL